MLETILIATVPTVVMSSIVAWVTSILQKKKYLAETVSVEQKNLQTQMETYEKFLDNTSERVNRMAFEFKEREQFFLEREAEYLEKIKNQDIRIKNLEIRMEKMFYKVCARQNCENRIYFSVEKYMRNEDLEFDNNSNSVGGQHCGECFS
jgi:type III secretory pathway component EscR